MKACGDIHRVYMSMNRCCLCHCHKTWMDFPRRIAGTAPCIALRHCCTVYVPCAQPQEVYVDDESKLTLHGLVQHYLMLHEDQKNRKLTDLLDALDFNQVGVQSVVVGCRRGI